MLVGAWLLEEAIKKLMGFEATFFENVKVNINLGKIDLLVHFLCLRSKLLLTTKFQNCFL